ncbi:MAG: hypothetical protein JWN84_3476 [Nocardioides sp.]|nr:hypothetical protein [Nocardioides sp.]
MTTHRNTRRLQLAAAVTVASALLLAGCGGSSDERGPAGTAATGPATPSASATPTEEPTSTDVLDDNEVTGAEDLGTTPQEDVFSVESPWNTLINDAQVAPDSELLLENSKFRTLIGFNGETETQEVTEGVYINTREWTTPVVADGVPTVVTCRQEKCGDGGDDITLDIPTNINPNPLYDGWFTVFDPDAGIAYDLWRARREDDGTISYHFMRTWDLNGRGYSEPYVVSARGSGLPLFGGLIRPGELERCQINHALAISVPGPAANFFIQPASSTDGNNNDDNSLPEGARIRLRGDFDVVDPIDPVTGRALPFNADRRKHADCIVTALREYGAIVVDRAAVPTLYFQQLPPEEGRRPLLNGYELNSLGLEDFVVVDFNDETRYPYPPEDETVDPTLLDFGGDDTPTTTTDTTLDDQAEGDS